MPQTAALHTIAGASPGYKPPSTAKMGGEIAQLRALLLGKDYDSLLALKQQFENSEQYSSHVAHIISEALTLRAAQDNSLADALGSTVEQSLTQAVFNNPKRLADALYPVMGPAIRKSIQEALSETLENLNRLLEESFSIRSLRWRFDAWRSGRTYAEVALMKTLVYQAEQVFLIHRDSGLLLRHLVSDKAISKDPEMVSGMLTAIQDFVTDSFATESGDTLRTLSIGGLTVLIEHGPLAIMALVVRGSTPGELRALLSSTSETIHRTYAAPLKTYAGDASIFPDIDSILSQCLQTRQQQATKRTPWFAYIALSLLLAGLGYWAYQHYQTQQAWQATLEKIKAEPGVIILDVEKTGHGYKLHGLLDPLARDPAHNLSDSTKAEFPLEFSWEPYLSMEPALVQARAKKQQEQEDAQAKALAAAQAADAARLTSLVQQVETARYTFDLAQTHVDIANPALKNLSDTLKALLTSATHNNKTPQVRISGNTDETGSGTLNQILAFQRAENIRNALIATGVPPFLLSTQGAEVKGLATNGKKNERSVNYHVELY
jgi:outer membrane protein OmpA-like peptidoglycan-associated protein